MDNDSYEQITMSKDMIGPALPFLQDGMTVEIETYEGRPLSVKLPQKVVMKIVDADPVVKGQTAASLLQTGHSGKRRARDGAAIHPGRRNHRRRYVYAGICRTCQTGGVKR